MDLSKFKSTLTFKNRAVRLLWFFCWTLLFYPSPRFCWAWRRALLSLFGAKIGKRVRVDPTVKIFLPSNLTMHDNVLIGPRTELYCVAEISISKNSMVSQYSYLCTASHDYQYSDLPLIAKPIFVGEGTWICADAFIGPGVSLGDNVLVAARSVVVKDVPGDQIVGGNPAKFIKEKSRPKASF